MRYDKKVIFRKLDETYNADTGNYDKGEPTDTLEIADVMDSSTELMRLVYGGVKQGSLIIQLQNHHKEPFDEIVYEGKRFRVDFERMLRTKHTFVVSEVQ